MVESCSEGRAPAGDSDRLHLGSPWLRSASCSGAFATICWHTPLGRHVARVEHRVAKRDWCDACGELPGQGRQIRQCARISGMVIYVYKKGNIWGLLKVVQIFSKGIWTGLYIVSWQPFESPFKPFGKVLSTLFQVSFLPNVFNIFLKPLGKVLLRGFLKLL